ncbi:MAG: nucleotidyltransferase family protein, partial [Mesorhizobium sp.]
LVRRVAHRALASAAAGVTVVTGHQSAEIAAEIDDERIEILQNQDFAAGLSTSLKAGIGSVPESAAGALVLLGDMPEVSTSDMDRLIAAFVETRGVAIVRASFAGKRGNPVILPRAAFADIAAIEGDSGARSVIESGRFEVVDVDIGPAAMVDVDTPEAMEMAGGKLVV